MPDVIVPIAGDGTYWLDGQSVNFGRIGPNTSGRYDYWQAGLPVALKDRTSVHGAVNAVSYVWMGVDMGQIWVT